MKESSYRSGFVTIIGRPNAGKSTLLNRLLGSKVVITSDKPQTTRNVVRGIYSAEDMQVVFMDTPGIHKPHDKMGKYMLSATYAAMQSVDVILYMVDASSVFGSGEEFILNALADYRIPVFLLLNKIDLLAKDDLLPLMGIYAAKFGFAEIIPVSAKTGDNAGDILKTLFRYMPQGERYYPHEEVDDQPETFFIAELIREQVLLKTREEIPHSTAVSVTEFRENPSERLFIGATIFVDRESQKGIIIGKKGSMLKDIGTSARKEIERIFGCGIYLELKVKTKKDWRNNDVLLRDWLIKADD